VRELRFTVPLDACSPSKNSRQLTHTQSGRLRSHPSTKAQTGRQQIKGMAWNARTGRPGGRSAEPLFPDEDIAVNITHHVFEDSVEVEVCTCGPQPKGKTGRGRDLDNLASTILDALNGIAYDDDRQVAWLQVKRA
jgi:hypothetical protein